MFQFQPKLKPLAIFALALASLTSLSFAGTVTLDGTNFAANGGTFAVNNGSNFAVSSTGITDVNVTNGSVAWASQSNNTTAPGEILLLSEPPAGGYTDAGMVLFFNNPIALSDFVSAQFNFITIAGAAPNAPLQSNLWLDTNGNGQPLSFNTSGIYQGLGGDTVVDGGSNVVNGLIDGSTVFNGFTLSQYANGDVAGINGNTEFALWVGISGSADAQDVISNVVVTTAVPLPSAAGMGLGMLGLIGAAGLLRKKLRTA